MKPKKNIITKVAGAAIKAVTKSSPAKSAAKANARGLKAANKPVSKNNRNRFGDGEMSSYLKSTKPARTNRTRAEGKSSPKGVVEIQGKNYNTGGPAEKKMAELRKIQQIKKSK